MNMFTSSSKDSDDGLNDSYNISLMIAKAGKPTTIGEELILPAVKEVIKSALHTSLEQVINRLLTVTTQFNKEETKCLKTSKRSSVRCS